MTAIVITASAQMPSSCRGRYRNVYVVDVPYWLANQHAIIHPNAAQRWGGERFRKWQPSSIRDKNIKTVIAQYRRLNVGTTERCAYQVALKAAHELALRFNSAGDAAEAEQLIGAGGSA
jgi:hypothetical protein